MALNLKHINKYEPTWQLTRVNLKGDFDIQEKFITLEKFLETNKTYEAWGRAINWLEGLKRGYKRSSEEKVLMCQDIINSLETHLNTLPHEEISIEAESITQTIKQWTTVDLLRVWESLYGYEKDFTSRGYRHSRLELLVDQLHIELKERKHEGYLSKKPYSNILLFRETSSHNKNSKKRFFF